MKKQKVIVRLSFEIEMDFNEDMEPSEIDFYLNEGSTCASNRIDEIREHLDAIEKAGGDCPCDTFRGSIVRFVNPPPLGETLRNLYELSNGAFDGIVDVQAYCDELRGREPREEEGK